METIIKQLRRIILESKSNQDVFSKLNYMGLVASVHDRSFVKTEYFSVRQSGLFMDVVLFGLICEDPVTFCIRVPVLLVKKVSFNLEHHALSFLSIAEKDNPDIFCRLDKIRKNFVVNVFTIDRRYLFDQYY